MDGGQVISRHAAVRAASAPGLRWAGRILRRQLDTLARLAAIALRRTGPSQAAAPARGALAAMDAPEATERPRLRAGWVVRLIEALRLKLDRDLRRLERGEPSGIAASRKAGAEAAGPAAPPPQSLAERVAAELESLRADIAAIERGERPAFLDAWPPETEDSEAEDVEGGDVEAGGRAMRCRQARDHGRDEFADILERPTDEVLALICRELGLPADWLDEAAAAFEAEEEREASEVRLPVDRSRARAGGDAPFFRPEDG